MSHLRNRILTGALVAFVCLVPSLQAGIIFTAGNETVGPGGSGSVPITVSSTLTSEGWLNAGFRLAWNQNVLTLQPPVIVAGSALPLSAAGNFDSSTPGTLVFTWYSGTGVQVPDGSTLCTLDFTAVGGSGSSTSVSFTSVDQILFSDFTFTSPTGADGRLTVVPEPINRALGLFACLFLGTATVRWIYRRRTPLQLHQPQLPERCISRPARL